MTEEQARVPKLRFPGFADAWEQRKLGDVVRLAGGGTPSKANPSFWNGDIVWLSSQEIKGRFTDHGTYKISQEAVRKSAAKMVQIDTPLIVYRSGILAHSFPITRPTVAVAINQDIKALLFDHSKLNTQFVVSQLESKEEYILRNIVKTGTTVQSVNIPDFVRMPFSVPNIAEQSELAEFFASLDDLIALHQRKLSHLDLLKKGLLQKMFPKQGEAYPEIRFPGFTDAWEQRKLGELGTTFSGLSGKSKEDFGHGDAEFVTYMNVFSNPISDVRQTECVEIDKKQNEVQCGDVLFTTSSETPEEVGMSSVWLENKPNVYLNSFSFGWRPTVNIDRKYLAYVLRSSTIRRQFVFLAQGISRYNISKNKVMDIPMALPNLSEQRRVGAFFASLDDLIALHQRKLSHLQQQKKALLQQMFV